MESIEFLSFDDVLAIHADQLHRYGGREGFIDRTVIESAIGMPQQSAFGQFLHEDIVAMAAAYLFHLAASQGFVDGNKRTALVAAAEFLARNGYRLNCTDMEIYDLTIRVANRLADKSAAGDWMRERIEPIV